MTAPVPGRSSAAGPRLALATALVPAALLFGAAVVAPAQQAWGQQARQEPSPAEPGTTGRAFLQIDRSSAAPGETVTVAVVFAPPAGEVATVAGFTVELRYDPGLLRPVRALAPPDGMLRLANLEAGEGRVRAAGAGARGTREPVLVAVEMEVVGGPGYAEGLTLELAELVVVEEAFANVAGRVSVAAAPVVAELPEGLEALSRSR